MGEILVQIIEQLENFTSRVEAEYGGYEIKAYRLGDNKHLRIDLVKKEKW